MTMVQMMGMGLLVSLAACRGPASGTFVGNPNLTARYIDNDIQRARGGRLVASEVHLLPCDGGGDVSVGPKTFEFEANQSLDTLQLPPGDYCGLFLVVKELRVAFDEEGADTTTVIGRGFPLTISGSFAPRAGDYYQTRLANEDWLAALAEHTAPGENLADGGNLALEEVFFGGLSEDSAVERSNPDDEPPPLGRLDLDDYLASPRGTPTRVSGCGPGFVAELAIPIPPAAMLAQEEAEGEIGWCEGTVRFADDVVRTAIQVDYSTLSTYPVSYNGWGQGCDALHCNELYTFEGITTGKACTVLALCDGGEAFVTGYSW